MCDFAHIQRIHVRVIRADCVARFIKGSNDCIAVTYAAAARVSRSITDVRRVAADP